MIVNWYQCGKNAVMIYEWDTNVYRINFHLCQKFNKQVQNPQFLGKLTAALIVSLLFWILMHTKLCNRDACYNQLC